jgi:hypothetical protein
MRILLEVLGGVGFCALGVFYLRDARARCDRMRAEARARAERASPRWRWFFYPRSWYDTGQDLLAVRSTGVGLILSGSILLVVAALTAFHVHP